MAPQTAKELEAAKKRNRNLSIQRNIWLFTCLVCAASVGILFYKIQHQAGQIKKQNVAIQNERRDSVLRSCRDQNDRHGEALTALDDILTKAGVTSKRRARSHLQIDPLINALAPKRNCIKVANATVNTDKKVKPGHKQPTKKEKSVAAAF